MKKILALLLVLAMAMALVACGSSTPASTEAGGETAAATEATASAADAIPDEMTSEYMMEYAKNHHFAFRINLAVDKFVDKVKEIYQDKFLYLHNEDNDDYVYEKKSLETLSGKKMQKRRNHFNAFIKEHPNYIYKEIENEDIDNVLNCLKRWDTNHSNENSVVSEFIGIVYLLVHRKKLDIKTGCIYLNGQLEAFIIGSPLKHKTVQIHVEKANKDIRGLYVAIGKFFLEQNRV